MMGGKSDYSNQFTYLINYLNQFLASTNFKYKASTLTYRQYLVCLMWFALTTAPAAKIFSNLKSFFPEFCATQYHVSISRVIIRLYSISRLPSVL